MKEYLLKEIANVKNGYAFDSSKYSDKGIPIIRIADIKDNIDLSKCVCIDEEINKEFLIKKGSLLIALSGATTGKMGVFSDNKIAYLNQRICSIYTKNKDISQEFLIYFLKSIQKKIIVNSYGGAQPNISSRWIENIKIKVPNIEIQKKISKKLELLVNNIKLRKSQLVFLKELTKSLFRSLFLYSIQDYKEKKLEDIVEVKSSKRVFLNELSKNGIPFYRGTEIAKLSRGENVESNLFISEDLYQNLKKISDVPKIGDLLLPSICNNGEIWYVNKTNPFYFKDGRVLWLKLNKNINGKYLQYYLIEKFRQDYSKIASGTTFSELKIVTLKNLLLPVPPIELQKKFAERVEKIEKLSFRYSRVGA